MATFPSITPTYGIQKRSAPNVRTVRFGDGFEKRLTYGLNQNPKVYNLTFEVSSTDSNTIETFLDARAADNAAFDFTPPGEGSSSKFVCEEWSKSIPYLNRATIQATFRQVFEP
jgi:phage-related protein|tara:strand:+ start:1908 stop:2249 length:342 start_codon:yes stop_codon:yes gene_type:complete